MPFYRRFTTGVGLYRCRSRTIPEFPGLLSFCVATFPGTIKVNISLYTKTRGRCVMKARRDELPPDLLTAQEVARRLSIGVRTLYRLVRAGRVPPPMRFNRKLIRW